MYFHCLHRFRLTLFLVRYIPMVQFCSNSLLLQCTSNWGVCCRFGWKAVLDIRTWDGTRLLMLIVSSHLPLVHLTWKVLMWTTVLTNQNELLSHIVGDRKYWEPWGFEGTQCKRMGIYGRAETRDQKQIQTFPQDPCRWEGTQHVQR